MKKAVIALGNIGQVPNELDLCFCLKEQKYFKSRNFYSYKDGTKATDCKKCMTLHINNYDELTFKPILKELDVPYSPTEWHACIVQYKQRFPNKEMTGMSILGRYLAKMKLTKWRQLHYEDSAKLVTEELKAELQKQIEADKERERYFQELEYRKDMGQISQAKYELLKRDYDDLNSGRIEKVATLAQEVLKNTTPLSAIPDSLTIAIGGEEDLPKKELSLQEKLENSALNSSKALDFAPPLSSFAFDTGEEELEITLSPLDRDYLQNKWGRAYTPTQWLELEEDFIRTGIDDEELRNSVIVMCKNNLKMNLALDMDDFETFQKLVKTSDILRKSINATTKQKKEDSSDSFMTSFGELIKFCEEKTGWIPEYKVEYPRDAIDTFIEDTKSYTKDLIMGENDIERLVRSYLTKKDLMETARMAKDLGLGEELLKIKNLEEFEDIEKTDTAIIDKKTGKPILSLDGYISDEEDDGDD